MTIQIVDMNQIFKAKLGDCCCSLVRTPMILTTLLSVRHDVKLPLAVYAKSIARSRPFKPCRLWAWNRMRLGWISLVALVAGFAGARRAVGRARCAWSRNVLFIHEKFAPVEISGSIIFLAQNSSHLY